MKFIILLVVVYIKYSFCFSDIRDVMSDTLTSIPQDLPFALKDFVEGLPAKTIAVIRGNSTNIRSSEIFQLLSILNKHNIQTVNLNISSADNKALYIKYIKEALDKSEERNSFILCEPSECEALLSELTVTNLIHRTILYMFFWPYGVISQTFLDTMSEAMRIAVITNPRPGVFRIYYNQAKSDRLHQLSMVNWWAGSLYKSPLLPPPDKVYHDFKGRIFNVPVLHVSTEGKADVSGGFVVKQPGQQDPDFKRRLFNVPMLHKSDLFIL